MKKVLVVIVTYNGMRWLARCLDSVAGKADGPVGKEFVVNADFWFYCKPEVRAVKIVFERSAKK